MKPSLNEATRTTVAEAILAEVLHRLEVEPVWSIAGMGAAEAKVRLNDTTIRVTIGVDETDNDRLSILQAALAHRACER